MSKKTILLFAIGVPVMTIAYSIVFVILAGNSWMRKEGDLPAVSARVQEAEWAVMEFPFATVGLVDSILILPVVNGLFWGVMLSTVIYVIIRSLIKTPNKPDSGDALKRA